MNRRTFARALLALSAGLSSSGVSLNFSSAESEQKFYSSKELAEILQSQDELVLIIQAIVAIRLISAFKVKGVEEKKLVNDEVFKRLVDQILNSNKQEILQKLSAGDFEATLKAVGAEIAAPAVQSLNRELGDTCGGPNSPILVNFSNRLVQFIEIVVIIAPTTENKKESIFCKIYGLSWCFNCSS